MAKKGKKNAPKRKVHGYKMPPPIPPGEIIRHGSKEWLIGPSIGVGGFGEIYSACEYKKDGSLPKDSADYPYVVKIEPVENGPLFVEMHFYNRNYNRDDIEQFMRSRNLSQLGMPTYIGSGTQMIQGEELRFLIIERYGTDLWKIFKEVGRKFPAPTVFQLGLQMLDVLDYVHSRSYIHADIKGANILLGIKEGAQNQAYLLDFGLAYRIVDDNYRADPKSAHEGTIEYTSTDRHVGAKTMRGDLEVLGYNLLQWLVGELPWERALEDPAAVHRMKADLMEHARSMIAADYPHVPDELIQFFEYIKTLEQKDVPDYTICRKFFETYLTRLGRTRNSQLEFKTNIENDYHSKLGKNQEEIDTDNKTPKEKVTETSENMLDNDRVSELIGKNQEEIIMNSKKTIGKKVSLERKEILVNDAENEQSAENQDKATSAKKIKMQRNHDSQESAVEENEVENEQTDVIQEEKAMKIEKLKDKDLRNAPPLKNVDENEFVDKSSVKIKKHKKKREKLLDDTDYDKPESAENQYKATSAKKIKMQRNHDPQESALEENEVENEQTDVIQEEKAMKTEKLKDKDLRNAPPLKNVDENEFVDKSSVKIKKHKKKREKLLDDTDYDKQPESAENQDKATSAKKIKMQRNHDPQESAVEENEVENEQTDVIQEEKAMKIEKLKDKDLGNAPPLKNVDENEFVDKSSVKNKKHKKKREKLLDDSDYDKQPDESQLQTKKQNNKDPADTTFENGDKNDNPRKKAAKNKKKRTKDPEEMPLADFSDNNEILEDYPKVVAINKKNKRKSKHLGDTLPTEDDEKLVEKLKRKDTKYKQVKKQKDKKNQETAAEENNDENKDLVQAKSKKNKRKRVSKTNDEENDQIDHMEEEDVKTPKTSKRKRDKKPDGASEVEYEFNDEYQEPVKKKRRSTRTLPERVKIDDMEEKEVKTSKTIKRKRDKKSKGVNAVENECSDEYQYPLKKKRRSSRTTPKNKNKNKASVYTESDSESELSTKKKNKKRNRIKFEPNLKNPKLPEKEVKFNTLLQEWSLRSGGKTKRPDYKA